MIGRRSIWILLLSGLPTSACMDGWEPPADLAGAGGNTDDGGSGAAPDRPAEDGRTDGEAGFSDDRTDVDSNCVPSKLYGTSGDLWTPGERLLDYAYAGYHSGLDPIPEITGPMQSVIDFGAIPGDDADDTQAFLTAIANTPSGVLFVPAGRYLISERLSIAKSHFVLRGAGAGKTVLYFPKSLGDIYGLTFNSSGQSNWSFAGAFLAVQGLDRGIGLTSITSNAARGARELAVSTSTGILPGQWVRITQTDSGGSMLQALYGGAYPGDVAEDGGKELFHFETPIESVASDAAVTLARPLPFEVNTNWKPDISAVDSSGEEVGIEDMTLEMAGTPYPGHFKEHGYNGIQLNGTRHSWVRGVEVLNADLGISITNSSFVTVTDVVLDTNFDRGPLVGHHGLNSAGGSDIWFNHFDVKKTFIHDLTVDAYALGTVWSDGKGVDLNMDHHGRAPYGTLWTKLDLGLGSRPFISGGATQRMPPTGAYSTFWNLVAMWAIVPPPADFGPLANFVAVAGTTAENPVPDGWSVETISQSDLCQPDLHAAMLARRRR